MLTQLLPPVFGALVGLAGGGSLAGLNRRIAWWQLGLASIFVQLIMSRIPVTGQPFVAVNAHWLWALTVACILPVLVRNLWSSHAIQRLPWLFAATGVALNLVVIFGNGGYMPVDTAGLEQTGQTTELAARTTFRRDIPIDQSTRLPWLADVLADPAWMPRPLVWSVGDRLLGLGLACWAFLAVWKARPSYAARSVGAALSTSADRLDLSANHRSSTSAATGLQAK